MKDSCGKDDEFIILSSSRSSPQNHIKGNIIERRNFGLGRDSDSNDELDLTMGDTVLKIGSRPSVATTQKRVSYRDLERFVASERDYGPGYNTVPMNNSQRRLNYASVMSKASNQRPL